MLNDATVMQLTMLNPVDRPSEYDDILDDNTLANTAKGNFTVPAHWTYHDEDIQRAHQALIRDLRKPASQG